MGRAALKSVGSRTPNQAVWNEYSDDFATATLENLRKGGTKMN